MNSAPVSRHINQDVEVLRGIAILLVLLAHARFLLPGTAIAQLVETWRLPIGVDLFFIISGFVITSSLYRDAERHVNASPSVLLLRFWTRRAFRLLPAAFTTIVIAFAVSWALLQIPIKVVSEASAAAILNVFNIYAYRMLHTPGVLIGPFWSLSLEEQFYFIFPVLLLSCGSRKRLAAVSIAMILLMRFAFDALESLFWFIRIDGLFWGVLIACVAPTPKRRAATPSFGLLGLSMLAAAIPAMIGAVMIVPGYWGIYGLPILSAAALVFVAALDQGAFHLFGLGSVLSYVGTRSYAIYLLHVTLFVVARYCTGKLFQSSEAANLAAVAGLAPCLIIVEIFHRSIEVHFREVGRRIASRIGTRRPMIALTAMPPVSVNSSSSG